MSDGMRPFFSRKNVRVLRDSQRQIKYIASVPIIDLKDGNTHFTSITNLVVFSNRLTFTTFRFLLFILWKVEIVK